MAQDQDRYLQVAVPTSSFLTQSPTAPARGSTHQPPSEHGLQGAQQEGFLAKGAKYQTLNTKRQKREELF